ncbi:MAG: HIT domain-containing protein [Lachnospiraceae bacterium]|nr:HIT domain-containing protein [Lachnospiraceae bacterium]
MEECIFCKIVSGEVSSMKVYEDEYTLAFMDIAGDVDGHILVIPKEHCKNILDCNYHVLNDIMNTVKKIAEHLVENCRYDGVNILNASDESAGQSVPHFHIHIIPRRNNDGIDAWPVFEGANCEIEEIYRKIKMDEC